MKKLLVFLMAFLALMGSAAAFNVPAQQSLLAHTEDCCQSLDGIPSLDFAELGPYVSTGASTHITCEFGDCVKHTLTGLLFEKVDRDQVHTNMRFGVHKAFGECIKHKVVQKKVPLIQTNSCN